MKANLQQNGQWTSLSGSYPSCNIYDFYDEMNSINTIDHLENLKLYIMKNGLWKRLILIWDNASFHLSKTVMDYVNTQKEDWLTIIHLPKKAPYLNPNERKVNQQIKSDVMCKQVLWSHRRTKNCSIRISGQKIWKMVLWRH